jgi:hypothetical protein
MPTGEQEVVLLVEKSETVYFMIVIDFPPVPL